MKRFAFLGAAAAALFGGAIVLAAASPAPLPSSSAHPSATAHPTSSAAASAAPKASPSPAPTAGTAPATTEPTFKSQIQPLQISGAATIREAANGTAEMTLRVEGLLDAQHWTVDVDGGTIARPDESVEIAWKTGTDVTRLATDTVQIHLTRTEMAAFLKAQKAEGVVAVVSDGSRMGYAAFSAG